MHKDEIAIEEPCGVDFASMKAVSGGRHCEVCGIDVKDLSQLTERETRALLATSERLCVRYRSELNGLIIFRPEPLIPKSALLRVARKAVVAGIAAAAACSTAACMGARRVDPVAAPAVSQGGWRMPARDPQTDAGAPDAAAFTENIKPDSVK